MNETYLQQTETIAQQHNQSKCPDPRDIGTIQPPHLRLHDHYEEGQQMMTESGTDGCCVIVSPNTIRNCTHNVSQIRTPLHELTKDSTNRHANVNGENS